MVFADVIMPFTAIYFAWFWFFPVNILALASEVVVFKISYRELPVKTAIGYTLAANAASFLFGGFIACVLAICIEGYKGVFWSGKDPTYTYYLILGVLFAFVVSIYIELRVWQWIIGKRGLRSLDRTCAFANVASYVIIIGAVFALFGY